jgi:hypothetical protein
MQNLRPFINQGQIVHISLMQIALQADEFFVQQDILLQ